MTHRRFCIAAAIIVYVWIVLLAVVRVWMPEHTSYQRRWTQCMTAERSYAVCIEVVK